MKLSEFKKLLPSKYKKLPDEELEQLLNELELLADIILEVADDGSKKQLGVIDSSERKEQNGK